MSAASEPAEQEPRSGELAPLATAERLRDFSATKISLPSSPRSLTAVGGKALFFATDNVALAATDGTPGGTQLVRDITRRLESGTPVIVAHGGHGYWAQAGALWRSDGTGAGTEAVKVFGRTSNDTPSEPVSYNGLVYFSTDAGLWRSDGSEAGTQLVSSLQVSGRWQVMGGKLYFPCGSAATGRELCVSDGTAAGTTMVRELVPGINSADPKFLGVIGTQLLFTAYAPVQPLLQRYLWATDGTSAGTRQLVAPGSGVSIELGEYAEPLELLGGFAYFPCYTTATGFELCRTNGTPAGTSLLDLVAGSTSSSITSYRAFGGRLFFVNTQQGAGRELWSSNGTVAGTSMLLDLAPGIFDGVPFSQLVEVGSSLYFAGRSSTSGPMELWKTNGTAAGTVRVKAILPAGKPQSYPINLFDAVALGDKLIFGADDGTTSLEPWVSDGTEVGTVLLRDMQPARSEARMFELRALRGKQYLTVQEGQVGSLWKTDATAAGTASFQAGSFLLSQPVTTPTKQWLFYGHTGASAGALWKTDGVGAEGVKVQDLPGQALELFALGGKAVFAGTTPNFGYGLWLSDGTMAGTALSNPSVLNARGLGVANGKLWLAGLQGASGNELWVSDGTDAGTKAVKDIRVGNTSSDPREFVGLGGQVLFTAIDATSGRELWKTDGTEAGTARVIDLLPGSGSSGPSGLLAWKSIVLFSAVSVAQGGRELWKTDGTAAGTARLSTAVPASALVPWGDYVFFAATDAQGTELWRSDGTAAGTARVSDGYPGALSSYPDGLLLAGPTGPLVFAADSAATGREVWQLAQPLGTPALLADLSPGEKSSSPRAFSLQGSSLLFSADVGVGEALWRLDGVGSDAAAPALICPAPIAKHVASADGAAVTYPAPTVTDASLVAPVLTADWPSGSTFPLGVTLVTVTAVDGSNNVATCTFNVTLELAPIDENPQPGDPQEPGKPGTGSPHTDSGGCSATSGAGASAPMAVLLLGLVLAGRRRVSRR